jgi:flagellar motor switch protein FliG
MADGSRKLNGVERAAVLLLTLGEEGAASVLRHMGPKEVQKVGAAMASLQDISQEQVDRVMAAFLEEAGTRTALGMGTEDYIRKVLVQALGESKARSLLDRILMGGSHEGLENLRWMDPRTIADMVRGEHPQIIAIVLAYLDSDQAAEVLAQLPEGLRADLVVRVATLDTVQPAALTELNRVLEKQVSGSEPVNAASVGGRKVAADILNFLTTTLEAELLERVKETDPALSQELEDLMFVFDNLIELDNQSVQSLLRETSSDILLLALKGSDEAMREKFFSNMSKRAAEMLRDDLEAKGPVRLSEVEAAQKEILGIARRLAEEGHIVLGGKGAEQLV